MNIDQVSQPTNMRILSPASKIAAKDIVSSTFAISIQVCDVDKVLSEPITARVENYLSQSAAEAVMGCNEANGECSHVRARVHDSLR